MTVCSDAATVFLFCVTVTGKKLQKKSVSVNCHGTFLSVTSFHAKALMLGLLKTEVGGNSQSDKG